MKERLREAWSHFIRAEDYEAHMVAVGQAQANAQLVAEYFAAAPPKPDARVLFLGAGTGQMFDFVPPAFLEPYRTTFADINPAYLQRLRERLSSAHEIRYTTVQDDIEQSVLRPEFDLVVAVLVLEHVDWHKAVAAICRLSTARILVITQQNPQSEALALTARREVPGTMNIFREIHSELIPVPQLREGFRSLGFALAYDAVKDVLDGKQMVASGFEKQI